jgi:hypothetical protein
MEVTVLVLDYLAGGQCWLPWRSYQEVPVRTWRTCALTAGVVAEYRQ